MSKLWFALIAATPLLLGCRDTTGATPPLAQVVIGTIDAGGTLAAVIHGPASGSVGQRLEFTVSTVGNSCVAAAGAEVVTEGLLATVTPYDQEYSGRICLEYLKPYPRSISLVFDRAGDAIVRVQGRSFYQAGLVTVEHHLTIVP